MGRVSAFCLRMRLLIRPMRCWEMGDGRWKAFWGILVAVVCIQCISEDPMGIHSIFGMLV